MKQFLEELKNTKRSIFKSSYYEMLGAYKGELEITKAYNGRQILELLQNCDDEGSEKVLIRLDKENNTISISNLGRSFSEEGYRSLSISNLSSKTSKRKFIGNKGLGFRSIINWSNEIKIISNNICLTFSKEIIQAEFNALFEESIRKQILLERNLAEDIIPMPFLALPRIEDNTNSDNYATTIRIKYKSQFYEDIIGQIKSISSETLLFLHHINDIVFEGFEDIINLHRIKIPLEQKEAFQPEEKISINDKNWFIFREEEEIDSEVVDSENNETEFYQLKLAIQEDLSDNINLLFSYFKTKVEINLPFIIHGTFDLDPSRNQLNDSKKNRFIIDRLVNLMIKTTKYLSRDKVNWNPVLLLAYKSINNKTLQELGFYSKIDQAIRTESIFPCIDNTYRKLSEVYYMDDVFTHLIIKNSGEQYFEKMIMPLGDNNIGDIVDKIPKITFNTKVEKPIDAISKQMTDIDKRAEFIFQITKRFPSQKFNFLIDDLGQLIRKDIDVFTPANKDLSIPEFASIRIINTELYHKLISQFNLNTSKDKSRDLSTRLNVSCALQSYEPGPLARKIISSANEKIAQDASKHVHIISEMVKSLFHNYKQRESAQFLPLPNIPLLNKNGDKVLSKELYLSEFYKSGEITSDIFGSVYDNTELLASPNSFGLALEGVDVEPFFLWLGVNHYVNYVIESKPPESIEYFNFVHKLNQSPSFTYRVVEYKNISRLKDMFRILSIEQLIAWIHIDKVINLQIKDDFQTDTCHYIYYGVDNRFNVKPSYLKFKINELFYNFNNHLIDERYDWINAKQINYSDEIFIKNGIAKRNIDDILINLGATDDFSDLSIDRITEILEQLCVKYTDGKNSQSLYKKALKKYPKDAHLKRAISLFAHDGERLKLFKQEEIYFSDTIKIPLKLRKKYPIFNFPLRSGGRDAINFYKIKDLKNLKINVDSYTANDSLTFDFTDLFERLKPYILAYRIEKIEKDDIKRQELSKLNSIKFIFCNQIRCTINNDSFDIDNYEFITSDNKVYYIKINNFDTLNSLIKNSTFSDSFSEILANVFEVVGDKNEFRAIIRNDITDTDHSARKQLGNDLLLDAKELLGLSDYTISFWKAVFSAIGRGLNFRENNDIFLVEIKRCLEINLNIEEINYEIINEIENIDIIKPLFNQLNIDIGDFNKSAVYALSLKNYHKEKLKAYFYTQERLVKVSLWTSLKSKSIKEQSFFLNLISSYENHNSYIDEIAERNKTKFEIDIDSVFNEFVSSKLNKLSMVLEDIDLESILKENKKHFSEQELIKINSNVLLKSLMYFSDSLNHIKKEIKEEILSKDIITENEPKLGEYQIIKPKKVETIKLPKSFNGHSNSPYAPNSMNDIDKKRLGDISEDIVYNELVKLYGKSFVSPKSKEDEGLHYDIRYFNTEEKKWKYVEVKTFSNSRFFLSKDEKDFGEANRANYEIWLVNGTNIFPIVDFFSNANYILNPKDYIVSLEIEF